MCAVLNTLSAYPGLGTLQEIVESAGSMGFVIHDQQRLEALITARDLGLVEKDNNSLTDQGQILVEIERRIPDLFANIIHALQYSLWSPITPDLNCFSWSYRSLCQILWRGDVVDIGNRRSIASEIEMQARQAFNYSKISFSSKSVGGAILWLSALKPSVIYNRSNFFSRRTFCPPELMLIGIDFVYKESHLDYQANLLLDNGKVENLCEFCLLEPDSFERVLSYTVNQFDFLNKGFGGGWGRFLNLYRAPSLEDFT